MEMKELSARDIEAINSKRVGPVACPTGKQAFVNTAAAESFARQYHNQHPDKPMQSAYVCEQCPYIHLSYTDAESHALTKVVYDSVMACPPGLGEKYAHQQTRVKELHRAGVSISDIGKRLEIPYSSVYLFLKETGLHNPVPRQAVSKPTSATIESIDAKKAALLEQLKALDTQRQRIIEEKALRIIPAIEGNGLVIKQGGASLLLSFEDALKLTELLPAYLDRVTVGA
jgi:hypothetical protein